ncbi:MAG: hypothetical protein M3Y27_18705 [Acidobacteriota bacterium]|nr:hypothetical protein [Acidobacteriota bacterium]
MTSTNFALSTTLQTRAGEWFLHSGIQEPSGGVARYYRSDLGRNAPVSTEITGYAVSFLLYLYDQTGDAEYRDAGLRAARFLVATAWDGSLGVFPFEYGSNLSYFFDSGIIVRGLLSAWRATKKCEFLETALSAGRGMLTHFRAANAFHPILTLPDRKPRPYEARWSASPGCYQLKSAMAWYDLWKESGDVQMLAAYEAALEQALATEQDFLPGETDCAKVMDRLHAYAYFMEGMLPCADRPECARALVGGMAKVTQHLRDIAPSFARSDVYAQLLRIRLFADAFAVAPLNTVEAAKEAEAIATFQIDSGGFIFGTKRGEPMPFVNPVSTAFCAQALTLVGHALACPPLTSQPNRAATDDLI